MIDEKLLIWLQLWCVQCLRCLEECWHYSDIKWKRHLSVCSYGMFYAWRVWKNAGITATCCEIGICLEECWHNSNALWNRRLFAVVVYVSVPKVFGRMSAWQQCVMKWASVCSCGTFSARSVQKNAGMTMKCSEIGICLFAVMLCSMPLFWATKQQLNSDRWKATYLVAVMVCSMPQVFGRMSTWQWHAVK